jgi:hypothetical protein
LPLPTIPAKRAASKSAQEISATDNPDSYRARKKAKSKAASKANKAARPAVQLAKKVRSKQRLTARLERDATVVRMDSPAESLKASASGFSGSRVDWDETIELLMPSRITETLQSLLPVEFE